MAQSIEIPVSLGLKDAQSQIDQLRQSLQQSVKLDSTAGKGLTQILNNAQRMVDNLTGKMSTAFKSVSGSSSFLKDYEKMIGLLTTATEKMTNLGVTDIKFSVADQQTVDSTIQKIQTLQASLESIQSGKAIEVINMSSIDGVDNLRQQLDQLKIDASKLTFDEIGQRLGEAAEKANANVQELNNSISNIKAQASKLDTQGFAEISKLSDFSTKGVSRILDAGNVDSVNNKLQKLAQTMTEITVKPMTVTAGQNIDSVIESQTRAIEKKYNEQIQIIQQNKEKITQTINDVTQAGMRTSANGKTTSGHWTNAQMQELMSMPSVEGIINRLKADTTLNFDNLGIREQFAKFREALNQELNSLSTQQINLQGLRDNVKNEVTKVFEGAGEAIVGNRSQIQSSIKSLFSNLGINGDELKKIFDINSISSGDKMVDVINRIKEGLTSYIETLNQTANTDLQGKLTAAQAAFDGLTQAQATNQNVAQGSGAAAQSLQEQISTLAQQVQDLINKYNQLTGQNLNFNPGNIDGAKSQIESYIQSLNKLQSKQKALGNIQMAVNRWMGFWQVLNMTKSAINDMKQHIQELDTVMTSISVVTNFSQDDLWGQISQYSEIARQYGVAIKGVYEVSQIYYQQGLQQNDVMTLTTETLKMARIAGLDYATAADYMTTAIRGFKLEMTDAAHVTDVFSALAATTASSTEEIATAISKTASSAEAVGASFEATSAMMATMIATTRESATNIGTALKSVISRYGEMTSDPSKTVDSEGEEMSLNRVDKALQTVGITIHDTAGQFRDFDDVMLELMEKWNSLDSLSQRYIATLMAGNRQQSRFLALVSNVDEYKKALETAMDSEGTGELQTLKTLDSIDAKIEKMKVTIQEFYTSSGIEELYKSILDSITNIVSAANSLPKAFGKIPVAAVAMGTSIISAVKSAIQVILGEIQAGLEMMKGNTQSTMTGLISMMAQGGRQSGEAYRKEQEAAMNGSTAGKQGLSKGAVVGGMVLRYAGAALSIAGASQTLQGMNAYGASLTHDEDQAAANQVRTGGILGILGSTASGAAMGASFGPYGAIIGGAIGGIKGLVENIATLTSANEMYNVSVAREIELSNKRLEVAKQDQLEAKNTEKQLEQAYTKLKELEEHQYDSVEAQQEYHDYMNQLADSYPTYVEKINQANNAIIYSGTLEEELAKARELTASATTTAIEAELNKADWQETSINNFRNGLQGLYSEGLTTDNSSLTELAQVVRRAVGTNINQPTSLNYRALFEEGTMTEEQAAEYLVKSYLSRHSDIELDHYNRRTGQTDISQFGTHYTYKGLLDQTVGNSDKSLLELIMTDSNLGSERDAIEYSRSQFEKLLTDFTEEAEKAGQSISLETITKNKNIKKVSDIYNLTDREFQAAVAEAKTWADQTAAATESTKQGIETALISAKTREKVTTQINTLENKQDKTLAERYENLIAYGLSAKFGQDIDKIDSNQFNEAFTHLSDWIKNNQESAEALANIDYSQYTSFEELKDSIKNFGDLDDKIENQIETDFNEARTNAVTLYTNQLIGIFGDGKAPSWLTDTDQFTNRTLTVIQSDLKQYQSLMDKQQYAQAEAYFHNMEEIYGENGFGQLTSEQQAQAYDIIKDLDLSDPEALRSAAETFAGMGSDFSGISQQFIDAATRWAANGALLIEQLNSSAKDTAKSIESSTSDMSKVFKYSEALEKAQALMDANEGVEFKELFTYDKDLGGYVKTAKAFQLEMAELQNQQIEGISLAITDMTETLSSVFDNKDFINLANSSRAIETGQVKEKFAELTHTKEGDVNFDRLWLEYTQIIKDFRNQDKDWNTFITEYVNEHGAKLQLQLNEINNMSSQMASLQLKSFDYASIVSGKGTTQNKETMQALLTQAIDPAKFKLNQDRFNEAYAKLITGDLDSWNTYIDEINTKTGSNIAYADKGQANRARFEATLTAVQELSENKVYEALSAPTKALLEEYGITSQNTYNVANIANATNGFKQAIANYINSGIASISEVANYIDSQALQQGTGKQKVLMDAYGDQQFSTEELMKLGAIKDVQYDENQNLISYNMNSDWSSILKQNTATGAWEIDPELRKKGQAAILEALAKAYGIDQLDTLDESYEKALESGIEADNKQASKENSDLAAKSIFEQLSSAKVGSKIKVNQSALARYILKQAFGASAFDSNGQLVIASDEQLNKGITALESILNDESILSSETKAANPEVIKYINQMVTEAKVSNSKYTAIAGALGDTVSASAAEKLAHSYEEYTDTKAFMVEQLKFVYDEDSNSYLATADSIDAMQTKITELKSELETETDEDRRDYLQNQISTFQANLDNLKDSRNYKQGKALSNLLANYTNVKNEDIQNFIAEFANLQDFDINQYITEPDATGKRVLKIEELRQALKPFEQQLGFSVDEIFSSYIGSYVDTYSESIKKAQDYVKNGTTSRAEMETFAQQFKEATGDTLDIDKAFTYNTEKKTWKLDNNYLIRYAYARGQQLALIDQDYENYVNDLLKEDVASAITTAIESFAQDNKTSEQDLRDSLTAYYGNLSQSKREAEIAAINSMDASDLITKKGGVMLAHTGQETSLNILAGIRQELIDEVNQEFDNAIQAEVNQAIANIEKGGAVAVAEYKKYKPEATEEQLAKVYSGTFDSWSSVVKSLTQISTGDYATGRLRTVLDELNMLDENGAVSNAFNMAKVYKAIYQKMADNAGKTTAGLNDVYAEMLTAEDQQNVDITSMLKNSQGMTYDALGKILARYNITLEEVLANEATAAAYGLERTGFGQVRLTDWESFAKNVFKTDNLDTIKNTDEYISAFKAYNDGLIALNKNAEDAIVKEVKQIESAKAGDWINLSQLWTAIEEALPSDDWTTYMGKAKGDQAQARAMQNQDWYKSVLGELNLWGASLEDGILKIGENANLLGIAQTLERAAQEAGLELGNGLEEVKDSILKVLKSYTDAITNGIKGGLSNTDASNLIKIADNLGINNLHFEQTTEGLKLSQQSAIELYQALAKVDSLQGKIVFDKLAESLKKSNENFATTPALLNRVKTLTEAIVTGREKINGVDQQISDARLEQYKAELEVAKEIVSVRSAAEDDSFNFMNNKIPAGQNNPLNYAKNWTKAIKEIKEAYKVKNTHDLNAGGVKRTKSGYMGYESFYNLINEINNMAGMMGKTVPIGHKLNGQALELDGSLTSASNALIEGITTLTAVDTGDMMINIGALGINLAKSGSELEKGIDKGIDAVADAQIKALDGMIAMLELIVQMEELGDVAGEDMTIELPDIVTDNPDFDQDLDGLSDQFEAWRDKFLEVGSESRKLAESITINGQNMVDWLSRAASEWTENDAAILNALYQAAISTDWNLDDIGGSLQQMLNSGKFGKLAEGFTITLDDVVYTIQHGVVVEAADFSDKDAQEVLKQYKADHQNEKLTDAQAQTRIVEAIQKYLNGEGASDGLTVTQILKLRHNTLIKTDEKGKDYIELTGKDGKPHRYGSDTSQFKAAVQEQILKDQGIDAKDISTDYDAGQAVATTTYGIKVQTKFKVTTNDTGKVTWNLDTNDPLSKYLQGYSGGSTREEVLKHLYSRLQDYAAHGDEEAIQALGDSTSFESFVYLHYGIHLQIQTEVYKTGPDGKPIKVDDPTKDPKLQKELKPYLDGEKKIEFDNNNEGKTTVTLGNGYTIQLDTDDISINGKVNQDLLRAKLAEIFGIDAGLQETITTAISNAFSKLPETLSSLNESAPTEAATALTNLSTAATTLSTIPWSTIAAGLASLQVPEGQLPNPQEGNPDSTTGTQDGKNPVIKPTVDTSEAESGVQRVANAVAGIGTKMETAGGEVSSGLATGITESAEVAYEASTELGEGTIESGQGALGVASPSTYMIEAGLNVDEGLSMGIEQGQEQVVATARTLGETVIEVIKTSLESVNEVVDNFVNKLKEIEATEIKPSVNTSSLNAALAELQEFKKPIDTDQIIHPSGQIDHIDDFNTNQTIITSGGVYDIGDFTTIQTIKTVGGGGGGGGGKGCFVAGTQISMANGTTKNIEDIVVGDLVVAYDYQYNQFVTGRINKAYVHHNTPSLMRVSFSDGRTVTLTPGHPLLSTKGWKSRDLANSLYEHKTVATWLEIGDIIIGLNGTSAVINIEDIEVPENYDTYNAEVATYHTFIANGLVAHNTKATAPNATGNIGLARATGTLMGELGPELVVSNGRYFVAGQDGAEMVDLADDAIVFNHLQTEQLLKNGMSSGRGRAVTNERNAVAFATGNVNGGPAMASASAALAALKQLRAMWQSLKSASVSDLAGAGGGGGGGGGGGDNAKIIDPRAWVDTVERWFDLMQKIAKCEREITHEETLRKKLQSDWLKNGKQYFASQTTSLKSLREQINLQEELNVSRRDYFNKRIEALENEPLGKLYKFDAKTGEMQFKGTQINGKDGVMEFLTDLVGFDSNKGANYTNKEKYDILMKAGFANYMKFDSNGMPIKKDSDNDGETTDEELESYYENATKAFWEHVDEFKESTESLFESIAEGENKLLELQASMNEIWEEMRDNQMEVENEVLEAIEDMKQREIDALQDERDKLEESVSKYIDGLTDALNKEQEMYEDQEAESELNRKRRQLGILQRSGASAADISSLQSEIDSSARDMYFDAQQRQIDAIQEASDKQLERMDTQIQLMTQQLEYQKMYGLLWNDVYSVMNTSAQQITDFIVHGNSKFWAESPLSTQDKVNELIFKTEQWDEYKKSIDPITKLAVMTKKQMDAEAYNTFNQAMTNKYGANYDKGNKYTKAGGYQEKFNTVWKETGDVTKATETARAAYAQDKKYLDQEAAAKSAGKTWMKKTAGDEYKSINDKQHWHYYYAEQTVAGVKGYYFQKAVKEDHNWSGDRCSKCGHTKPKPQASSGGGWVGPKGCGQNCSGYCKDELTGGSGGGNSGTKNHVTLQSCRNSCTGACKSTGAGRARGGYVGHGVYELGEQGTETVLTASQTQVLRNNILSNRPNSLISLLKTYNSGFNQNKLASYSSDIQKRNEASESINIENATVNMNVSQIANDYDARRAGEQAMNEIMRIARKTSAANSIRR